MDISKEAAEDICVPVCDIVNCTLETFPLKRKRAQISPVPKTSTPLSLNDYRPISLVFHLDKLAEEVIISRMINRTKEPINRN